MPLDDLFQDKEISIKTSKTALIQKWKTLTYALLVVAYLSICLSGLLGFGLNTRFWILVVSTGIVLYFVGMGIALPLSWIASQFISYKDFTKNERMELFYFMIESIFYLIVTGITIYGLIIGDFLNFNS